MTSIHTFIPTSKTAYLIILVSVVKSGISENRRRWSGRGLNGFIHYPLMYPLRPAGRQAGVLESAVRGLNQLPLGNLRFDTIEDRTGVI